MLCMATYTPGAAIWAARRAPVRFCKASVVRITNGRMAPVSMIGTGGVWSSSTMVSPVSD